MRPRVLIISLLLCFTTVMTVNAQVPIASLTPRTNLGLRPIPLVVPPKYASAVPAGRTLWTPDGWEVKVFHAGNLGKPRFLAWGPDSVLHVANLGSAVVMALPDRDHDGVADTSIIAAENVEAHDVKFFRGAMYAAETTRILKLEDTDGDGVYETRSTFIDGIPPSGHSTRTIVFDTLRGVLYVSVGSNCNACRETTTAVIYEYQLDGTGGRVFANGIRNAVGLSLHPVTGRLWATNNGQDLQGDNVPPEWISVVRDGSFYGYPVAHSDQRYFDFSTVDQYRQLLPITAEDSARVRTMRPFSALVTAHSAPMAIEFANPSMPARYRNGAFVALRGSWNRSVPTGYKLVFLDFDGPDDTIANTMSYFLANDSNEVPSIIDWMRPVGLESDARGNIYFTSDDRTQLIGILRPTGTTGVAAERASDGVFLRIAPNPAAGAASVVVELPAASRGSIDLFDQRGGLIAPVAAGPFAAGSSRFAVDTSQLAAGVYQVRLAVAGRVVSRSLVVVR
jgi:glucose/arabinose dehydrogenase